MGISPSWAWVSTSVRAGLPVDAATRARNSGTGIPRGKSMSRVSSPARPSRSWRSGSGRRSRPRGPPVRAGPGAAAAGRTIAGFGGVSRAGAAERERRRDQEAGRDLLDEFADLVAVGSRVRVSRRTWR